ncbi:arsenate reductase (glutaredoxin) [Polaribacter pacificus]|uniref:Arsenate reductase (Glutaredoxin) n=1 Tax=Polaribacter pacificus TaxID=1775173 RepID=A0A917I120_9FLAO|nr:arsenate reductase (glutaredoxin) [Polaribacter pacificus]GGH02665.1 arsenate reductase (glutaredoxin) [Polaribacter pacificus]
MIKIYHNNRCSKSRLGLALVEASGKPFEVIKYLETPITIDELKEILLLLDIPAIDLVRKNEKTWKENFKGQNHTEDELLNIMVTNPKLIERPIVVNNKKAVIGRPTERINDIL